MNHPSTPLGGDLGGGNLDADPGDHGSSTPVGDPKRGFAAEPVQRTLRSSEWFAGPGKTGFGHRSWLRNQGMVDDSFDAKPIIGICDTTSGLNPCNQHLRGIAESAMKGIWQAGGVPIQFPTISLGEPLMRPTAMIYRNLMAMDVEESIRANPLDGVLLLGGCDKTTPALVMGAASVDLPSILITGGPMLNGKFEGRDVGSGTDVWKFSEAVRAGVMTEEEFVATESCMARSAGHCMTMGTASTMALLMETMGLQMPGTSSIPAVDARRHSSAQLAGRRIVEMVREDVRPSSILTRIAFENAIRVNAAIGGSTNAIIHLLAIAGRLGVALELDEFDELADDIPLLANILPTGAYLMEDFFYAGGLPAVIHELREVLDLDAMTVAGQTLGESIHGARVYNDDVIRSISRPLSAPAGTAVLRGNLAPDGAVIKRSAASPDLMQHRGRAIVFDSIEEFDERIDDPDLDVDADSILVLRNSGPKGYPGMPEIGSMTLPRKLLEQGVRDMVRVSDARMSGTSYGTVVLHVAPESAAGGPLALVVEGDWITLDVDRRQLTLEVGDDELELRRRAWVPPVSEHSRGYVGLYVAHVEQASAGADLDILKGSSGSAVPRRSF